MRENYVKRTTDIADLSFLTDRGFSDGIAAVIAARGVTADNAEEYLGDKMCFHSPSEMSGMDEAVELIRLAIENDGSILICGDYDADGLSASAVLSLYFTEHGVYNKVLIPTRDEGYGLHADAVVKEFSKHYYDLVITVDCGISNADEVERIKDELGVEVIVTDHHELPEVLPDCVCVNPKIGYPFAYLSGSGVAWKLVEALSDRQTAMDYVDLASIGTIGDIMPMTDENRAIVKCGIANWRNKGLCKLAELSKVSVSNLTSCDIAMRIVPKINAAGRVGNPYAALEVLLQHNKADKATSEKLLQLNEQRKEFLDDIVAEAETMIDPVAVRADRVVYLVGNKWQHGLLGIAAARFKEQYYLPAVVMTDDGDNYVGSARGIDGVDLFDAFRQCKDWLVKFGGHKASVGFTVSKQNVDALKQALSAVFANYDKEVFTKHMYYDAELGVDGTAQEIFKAQGYLQPLLPQDKIVCRVRDSVKFANAFGKDGTHLSVTLASGLELKGFFKYGVYAPYLNRGASVDLLCSLDVDSYTHNLGGIIEDITLTNSVCFDELYTLNFVKNCTANVPEELSDGDKLSTILQSDSVCAVFDDYDTYLANADNPVFDDYAVDVFFGTVNSGKRVAISPLPDYDFSQYNHVVYFVGGKACRQLPDNTVYVVCSPARADLYRVMLSRDIMKLTYAALRKKDPYDSVKSVFDRYLLNKMTYAQFLLAVRVFEELGLLKQIDRYTVEFVEGVRAELTNSALYRAFAE